VPYSFRRAAYIGALPLPGFSSVVGGFFAKLWKRTERPVLIILEHVIVTVASLFGIWIIEYILKVLGLSEKPIPYTTFLLSNLLYDLDIAASTIIILIGLVRAVWELLTGKQGVE
jgi:hypothetical protein